MNILSMYLNMPSSVSIYSDGEIVAATHEERFTRCKNDNRFPRQAVDSCLSTVGMTMDEIDHIVVASEFSSLSQILLKQYEWTVDDYLREQTDLWKPFLVDKKGPLKNELKLFSDWVDTNVYPGGLLEKYLDEEKPEPLFSRDRMQLVSEILDFPIDRIHWANHHRAHAAYSYYASPFRGEKILSFTTDGWGDGKNATIGIFDESGGYQEVYSTDQSAIGRIYRYITLLLGMKPNEHEFKVMGLAPYGREKYARRALDIFTETLYVDGIESIASS